MAINRKLIVSLSAVVAITSAVAACSDDDEKPGTGNGTGNGDGTGGGNGGANADASTSGDSSTSGKKQNAEVGCTEDAECESGVCYIGNGQSFCSLKCTVDNQATVCVAPFVGGCNNKGFCKRNTN